MMVEAADAEEPDLNARQPIHHGSPHAASQHPSSAPPRRPHPPASPFGCSCFFLPFRRKERKAEKSLCTGNPDSAIASRAPIQQIIVDGDDHEDDDDEWHAVLQKQIEESQQIMEEHAGGGLFDVKKTERDFKKASLKEKQLTKEAQKLLDMVASSERQP